MNSACFLKGFSIWVFLGVSTFAYSSVRPHIGKIAIVGSNANEERYLDYVESCLAKIHENTDDRIKSKLSFFIDQLNVFPDSPFAGGSADFNSISIGGLPDKSVACHESFHVFVEQAIKAGVALRKFKSHEKLISPLYEAVPQLMGVLGGEDCHLGKEGRFEFGVNHCEPIRWQDLPSLRETTKKEIGFLKNRGLPTDYWDEILANTSEKVLNRPSAYYSSIPLGYAIYNGFDTCGSDILLKVLISAFLKESSGSTSLERCVDGEDVSPGMKCGSFDSILYFSKSYLRELRETAAPQCVEVIKKNMEIVGLL